MSIEITQDDWYERFKPRTNEHGDLIDFMNTKEILSVDVSYIWTLVDSEPYPLLVSGTALVNRLNYYICDVPVPEGEHYHEVPDPDDLEMICPVCESMNYNYPDECEHCLENDDDSE